MLAKRITPRNDLVYLLGNVDSKKQERPSEIVGGSFLPVVITARKDAAKFKEPSFVYVYRDPKSLDELGGKEFETHLQECILETFFPGLDREQFNYLFIRHHNKDNSYELNFYCVCIANGKQFTPYLDWRDRKAHEYMGRMLHCQNKELTDPFSDMSFRLLATKSKGQKTKVFATEVNKILDDGIANKTINNRNDFLDKLESKGYAICRKGLEYFTVKKNDTKVRFYGRAADRSFDVNNIAKTKLLMSSETDWHALWQEENQKRKKKLIAKYNHLKELNYGNRISEQNKHGTFVRSNIGRSSQIIGDESQAMSSRNQSTSYRNKEPQNDESRDSRNHVELEESIGGYEKRSQRIPGSSKPNYTDNRSKIEFVFCREGNVCNDDFAKSVAPFFRGAKNESKQIFGGATERNQKALLRIRQICHGITQTAITLYQRVKSLFNRDRGGFDYDR